MLMRPTLIVSFLFLAALLAGLAGSAAAGPSSGTARIEVIPVDGKPILASSIGYQTRSGFSIQTADGSTTNLDVLDVVSVTFPPPPGSRKGGDSDEARAAVPLAHEVRLISEDRLVGKIETGDETGIFVASRSLGRRFVSIDFIAQVVFLENLRPSDLVSFPLKDDTDTAYRRTLAGRDVVTGVLLGFDDAGATLDSSIGEYRVAYRDLLAVTLLPQAEVEQPEELFAVVECHDGSEFRGLLHDLKSETLTLTSLLKEPYSIPVAALKSLSFRNGRFVFLSDLEPSLVHQTPFIGDPDDFLFPFRRDQSVGGNPMRIAGKEYARGIGVHSRCELTYALDGAYRRFRTRIGVDDEALELRFPGVVEFQVLVDGKSAFKSGLVRAGAPAALVGPIDVSGARKLTLRVDFGDDHHFGDRADWAEAMLIR